MPLDRQVQRVVASNVENPTLPRVHATKLPGIMPMITKRRPLHELNNKVHASNAASKDAEIAKKTLKAAPIEANKPVQKPKTEVARLENKNNEIVDPDAGSPNNPLMVLEYVNDIFHNLRRLESRYTLREGFLQGCLTTSNMRSVLIDWLTDVHDSFGMVAETQYLCVTIINEYLSKTNSVGRQVLQLVGATALWLAGKYEEVNVPSLEDFVYICKDTFTKQEFVNMERQILAKLNFNISRPLSIVFLRRYSKVGNVQPIHHTLAKYLLELSLLDCKFAHVKPSMLAAAACCLSLAILKESLPIKEWTPTLTHYTTYCYSDLKALIVLLAQTLADANTSKYRAIPRKYASSKYNKISQDPKVCNSHLLNKVSIVKKTPKS